METYEEDGKDGALEGRVEQCRRAALVCTARVDAVRCQAARSRSGARGAQVTVELGDPTGDEDDPSELEYRDLLLDERQRDGPALVQHVGPLTERHQEGPVKPAGDGFEDEEISRVTERGQRRRVRHPFRRPADQRADRFGDRHRQSRDAGVLEEGRVVRKDQGGEEDLRDADDVHEDVDLLGVVLPCELRRRLL